MAGEWSTRNRNRKKSNDTSERRKKQTVVIIVQSERHHFSPWFQRLTRSRCARSADAHEILRSHKSTANVQSETEFVNVSALPHSFLFYIEIYQSSAVPNVLNHALCKMTCFVGHQFLSRIRVNVLFIFGCGRPFRQIIDRDSPKPKFIFAVCGRHLIQKWTCETHLWSIQKSCPYWFGRALEIHAKVKSFEYS